MVSHEEELRVTYERGRIAGAARVAALTAENADLRARVAATEANQDELINVEAIYWRALTDVLIGAQQRSQSHVDVIELVAGALTAASAIMPLEKRAALPPPPAADDGGEG